MARKAEIIIGFLVATAFWSVVALFFQPSISWKDVLGPFATVAAAMAAAWVAYSLGRSQISVAETQADIAERNWQTANEKIVLDLFERRIAIFDGIRVVVSDVLRTGQPTQQKYFRYVQAIDRAPYYFPEVIEYLETLRHLINELLDQSVKSNIYDPARTERIRGRTTRMGQLSQFHETAKRLFGPYIQAHQKVV